MFSSLLFSPLLCSAHVFRTTSDFTRLVSCKNTSLYRASKPKVPGWATHCQGHERLPETQVWQRVTMPPTSTTTGSPSVDSLSFYPFLSLPLCSHQDYAITKFLHGRPRGTLVFYIPQHLCCRCRNMKRPDDILLLAQERDKKRSFVLIQHSNLRTTMQIIVACHRCR